MEEWILVYLLPSWNLSYLQKSITIREQFFSVSVSGMLRVFMLHGIPTGSKVSINSSWNFFILLSSLFKETYCLPYLSLFWATDEFNNN